MSCVKERARKCKEHSNPSKKWQTREKAARMTTRDADWNPFFWSLEAPGSGRWNRTTMIGKCENAQAFDYLFTHRCNTGQNQSAFWWQCRPQIREWRRWSFRGFEYESINLCSIDDPVSKQVFLFSLSRSSRPCFLKLTALLFSWCGIEFFSWVLRDTEFSLASPGIFFRMTQKFLSGIFRPRGMRFPIILMLYGTVLEYQ
jgi:hypothetical protein